MVSNKNIFANFEQMMSDLFALEGGVPPADITVVSWLPRPAKSRRTGGFIAMVQEAYLRGLVRVIARPAPVLACTLMALVATVVLFITIAFCATLCRHRGSFSSCSKVVAAQQLSLIWSPDAPI